MTTLPNGAICPAGYSCVPTTSISCPAGYICTPIVTANIQSSTSNYRPGTWSNAYLKNINSGANYRLSGNISSTSSTTSLLNNNSNFTVNNINAITVGQGKSYPYESLEEIKKNGVYILGLPRYTVSTVGAIMESRCKPGEFFLGSMTKGTATIYSDMGCVKNFIPVIASSSIFFSTIVPNIIKDLYCPNYKNVIKRETGSNTQEDSDCVIGEANRIPNYKNPWITADNLTGIHQVLPHSSNTMYPSTNYCKNIVSFDRAKQLDVEAKNINITSAYFSLSRLVINEAIPLTDILANHDSAIYYESNHKTYFWNGNIWAEQYIDGNGLMPAKIYKPNLSDWYDPKFQQLFQFYQVRSSSLAICLDNDYKSNILGTEWAGHYQATIYGLNIPKGNLK
ncbi:MAG: hypothetical protein WCK03_00460 [Candidatus Taylorbacteria bacterium]